MSDPPNLTRYTPDFGPEDARVRVSAALMAAGQAAELLSRVPSPETALRAGDRDLFRFYQAAETALGWLVGHGIADRLDHPAPGSALGDANRILAWTAEEAEAHFNSALQDLQESEK
jgi:hypothetical protein